jgi:hypothetical protein
MHKVVAQLVGGAHSIVALGGEPAGIVGRADPRRKWGHNVDHFLGRLLRVVLQAHANAVARAQFGHQRPVGWVKALCKHRRANRLANLEDARGIFARYTWLAKAGGVGDQLHTALAQNLVGAGDHLGRGLKRIEVRNPQLNRIKASRLNIVDDLREACAKLRPVKRLDCGAMVRHPIGVVGVAQRAPDIVGSHEGPLHGWFLFHFR